MKTTSPDLKALVADEVARQVANVVAAASVTKVLNFLNQKIGTEDKSEVAAWMLPNYDAGNTQTLSQFVAPMDGWVFVELGWSKTYKYASVNGHVFCVQNNQGDAGQQSAGCAPVSSGDVVTINTGTAKITFFPLKAI